MGFHFFELPQLPLWFSLFKAETEEELEKRAVQGLKERSEQNV